MRRNSRSKTPAKGFWQRLSAAGKLTVPRKSKLRGGHVSARSKARFREGPLKIAAMALFAVALVLILVLLFSPEKKEQPAKIEIQKEQRAVSREIYVKPYPLVISVYDHRKKTLIDMDLEEYIVSVVSAEVPMAYHDEAIKAQAIAARTYTAKKCRAFGGDGCGRGGDICTDFAHCAAYDDEEARKAKWGDGFEKNESRLRELVAETAGLVITYDDELITAFFHSTSGGMTENSENVFGEELPYCRSVESPYEENESRYTNSVSFSKTEFIKLLKKAYPKAALSADSPLDSIEVISRYESGRVSELTVGGAKTTGRELRTALNLDSANFLFEYSGGEVVVETRGFGHGVGLRQGGANGMANEGASYLEILCHYFTGVFIMNLGDIAK